MRYKSAIDELRLDTEQVKELELDEQARPTRKAGRPLIPSPDSATKLVHKKMKGTRKIR